MRHRLRTVLLMGVLLLLLGGVGFFSPAQEESIQLPPITTETLANGLKVIVIERPQLPIVRFNVRIPAGSVRDTRDTSGLAGFTADMLTKGTESRTADEIAEEIDFVGGALFASAGVDDAGVVSMVLTKDLDTGLDLLADVLLNPTFPEDEMEIVRNGLIGGVRAFQDSPGAVAGEHMRYMIFGDNHPLGYAETEDTVNAITRDDVADFYQQYYRPNGALLAVAGDVEPDEIIPRIRDAFGLWQTARVAPPIIPSLGPLEGHRVRFVDKPGQT